MQALLSFVSFCVISAMCYVACVQISRDGFFASWRRAQRGTSLRGKVLLVLLAYGTISVSHADVQLFLRSAGAEELIGSLNLDGQPALPAPIQQLA
jgi:hypothetical protein